MVILIQIQINIVLSILLVILTGHAYFNMNKKVITNELFMWIMGLTCFTLILEIFSVILNNPNMKQFMVLHKLVNIAGFIVTPSILFLGYLFSIEWVNFKDHVDAYNNTEKKPYRLKFSYGMACYAKDYESLYQVLEYADQLMYEQKQSRKAFNLNK